MAIAQCVEENKNSSIGNKNSLTEATRVKISVYMCEDFLCVFECNLF